MINNLVLKPLEKNNVRKNASRWLNVDENRKFLGLRHSEKKLTDEDVVAFAYECCEKKRYHWGVFADDIHIGNISCSLTDLSNKWIDVSFIIGDQTYRGQGLASLAVAAAINYLFNKGSFNRVQAHVVSENISSIKLMERLGMKKEAVLRDAAFLPKENIFVDEFVYGILKREWKKKLFDGMEKVKVFPMKWECK